jgi:hypothetical protein
MADSEDEIIQEWVEQIPDPDRTFMRVHVQWLRPPTRALHAGVFREIEGAISTDWEKYSTAKETRDRGRNPGQNGVIALVTGNVRGIEGLSVKHEPLPSNRAHSGIHGLTQPGSLPAEESKTKRRALLLGLVTGWEIDPFGPSAEGG